MRISRRVSAFVWILILYAGAALGQTAEVTHNINLRSDPSTANPPIRLLTPPEQVQLLEAGKTNGYYHVQTFVGEEGWVWSPNVHVLPVTLTPAPTPPRPTATPTESERAKKVRDHALGGSPDHEDRGLEEWGVGGSGEPAVTSW